MTHKKLTDRIEFLPCAFVALDKDGETFYKPLKGFGIFKRRAKTVLYQSADTARRMSPIGKCRMLYLRQHDMYR